MSTVRFFDDAGMDFAARCVLSGAPHAMTGTGEALAAFDRIVDGDHDSWLESFVELGRSLRSEAERAAAGGHSHSAWNAALRAANYLFAGLWWAPATGWADKASELWEEHRGGWDLAVAHWPTPVWPVRLPHHSTTLPGFWFRSPVAGDEPAPALCMIQGLGTPVSDAPMTGLDGALARGYHVLVLDGPGQGAALHRQQLTLEHDWAGIVSSLVEWIDTRPEADPDRIVVSGISHGSLFASLGVAGSDRVAALVIDPGVTDLGADARAAVADASGEVDLALLRGTTTDPTGAADLDAALEVLDGWTMTAQEIASISCPIFVGQADRAGSFCGQTDAFLAAVTAPVHRVRFSSADGAGMDCGIGASQRHDAAVFDWLDDTLVDRRPR